MKMAKSCEEGTAANQRRSGSEGHRFITRCQQGFSKAKSPLKSALLLLICEYNINYYARCIGWLHICFTCERCNMSSINLRSTRMVETLKKIQRQLSLRTFLFLNSQLEDSLSSQKHVMADKNLIDESKLTAKNRNNSWVLELISFLIEFAPQPEVN